MVTYADDGNVLDVVVGRHDVGLVMANCIGPCKLSIVMWLCSGMMVRTMREA
jgi:hypothetical protein